MAKERVKKPFYKKWWFFAIIAFIVLGVIFSPSEEEQKQAEQEKTEQQVAADKEKKSEEKENVIKEPIDIKIDVNKELNFSKFDVTVNKVKVYEKKEKILADIHLNWTNRANDYGEKMTLFVATSFDVKQGDTSLIEINDSWNPENQRANDVFFPNTLAGNTDVKLTYELQNETTPIEIVFTPTTKTEGSETVTVDFIE